MYGVENSYICHSQSFIGGLGRQHASCFINSRRYSWVGNSAHLRARDAEIHILNCQQYVFKSNI
jgi:hypothetical protein